MTASVPPAAPLEAAASIPVESVRIAKSRSGPRRFDRLVRLVSEPGFDLLLNSHVVIFGVGGVGGFAAEGLARSGIGKLTLVDFDVVCATNVNRQIQALANTVGKPKAELLAERVRAIHPQCQVTAVPQFYSEATAELLLPADDPPDFVVDAIDHVTAKMHLMDRCRRLGIPIVSSMGAAGKLDPTVIEVCDLYESHTDPLARALRRNLRRKYGWPEAVGKREKAVVSGVTVVYSRESRRMPIPPSWDREHGFQCICPHDENDIDLCHSRNLIEGSAVFVTSVFGMVAASVVVRRIVGDHVAPTRAEVGASRDGMPGCGTSPTPTDDEDD